MTEELKIYLDQSKQARARLSNLANKFKKKVESPSTSEQTSNTNQSFPNPTPARFKKFEEGLNKDLQKIFLKDSPDLESIYCSRSLSFKKSRKASAYNFGSPARNRASALPPILRKKEMSLLDRVLGDKYRHYDITETTSSANNKVSIKPTNTRFEIKKQLLVPILKKKSHRNILFSQNLRFI